MGVSVRGLEPRRPVRAFESRGQRSFLRAARSGLATQLSPLRHEQLAVFPIVRAAATGASRDGRYLTLRSGLERKEVVVEEVGRGGSVNTLA